MHPSIDDKAGADACKSSGVNDASRGISAAPSAHMPNNTSSSAFSSINITTLADVSGGCGGGRRCHGRCGNKQVNIVNNNYGAPQAPAAPAPSGIRFSVDVNAGYSSAVATQG